MEKEVKFSLVFRDMWQSAGKYVPRVDQLVKVAPAIIEMGEVLNKLICFLEKTRIKLCVNGQNRFTKQVFRHIC